MIADIIIRQNLVFFNYMRLKIKFFVNVVIYLHFQGHFTTIRWPDTVRSFWWKLWKSVECCRIYSTLFLFFQMTHFPPGKWRRSCAATTIHAHTFYRPRVPWSQSAKYLELVEQFARTLTIRVFLKNTEKGKTILGTDKFVLFPYTGLKIGWNFVTIFSRLRLSLAVCDYL